MTTAATRPIAFINTPVDFLLVGGFSILHFLLAYGLTKSGIATLPHTAAFAAGTLVWIINYPHFAATCHRLYASPENIRQFPVTAIVVPFVLFGIVALCVSMPYTVAPWLVKLLLIWSPYHYSAQSMGITLLYARRAGIKISPLTRRCVTIFIFMSFLGPIMNIDVGAHVTSYYSITVPKLGLPGGLWHICMTILGTAAFCAIALLWRDCRAQAKAIPLLMLVPAVAQFVWFVPGNGINGYEELVPAYHSLQYLLIAWAIQLKLRLDRGGKSPSWWFVGRESVQWSVINVAVGAFLFSTLPWVVYKMTGTHPVMTAGIVIAAVQIHHFFVDGVIWKLRTQRVSEPLMVNIDDLAGRAK